MNDYLKYLITALVGGTAVFISNYLLSKLKNKIDFSETQKDTNHDFDSRLKILEERTKNMK